MGAGALGRPPTTKSARFSDDPMPGGELLSPQRMPMARQYPPSAPELGVCMLGGEGVRDGRDLPQAPIVHWFPHLKCMTGAYEWNGINGCAVASASS